jgi:tetratricopeptide (TPR) repeat protein
VIPLPEPVAPVWDRPLTDLLGTGGFASVWAIDGGGVLKVAHADHDLARARLAREAEALAAIGSPAVPRLLDHGVLSDGRPWIAMERVVGPTLADLLATTTSTGTPQRIDLPLGLARAILDSLAHVHARGFVHRDLKPDNLVRRPDGSVCILDLGLARKLPRDPDDPTRSGVQVGSLEYMAPEQMLDAAAADERADLYAFGCILYEIYAGRPPFLGDAAALERAHAALRPPPLAALASVPTAVEAVCHECLAKQPARRPANAADVRARLAGGGEVSLARTYATSVVSEGRQPVVLVWAELPRVDRALLGVLAARKISIVSHRGRRVLGGVAGAEHADPAAAAIAAARDLAAAGARVALHLELLFVSPRISGDAVERPETWLPPEPWKGIMLTRSLAAVAHVATRGASAGSFVRLGDSDEAPALLGRDAELADLTADAAAALGTAGPALAVLVGEAGIGKSALAAALAPRLAELSRGVRVHVGAVPPPGAGRPGVSALTELIGTPEGPFVRAVGDALRAQARKQPTAILLDNVHLAESELLDALEYATLGGEPLPLWILALATPRLDQRRPDFGSRAERGRRGVLPPLDEDSAIALTAKLLEPAEYPPIRALRQIAQLARGNPLHLAGLAREIHDRGAIRTRPTGEHFLDTTALDALPPLALGPWLAARQLAGLGAELVAFARLCAVLGDSFERDEVAAVVELVERRGGPTTPIDVDVGLAELAGAGILAAPTGSALAWTFRQTLLQDGIYATTAEADRRIVHQAALDALRPRLHPSKSDPGAAHKAARHAEAAGERVVAAAAFATLGAAASRRYDMLEADQAWTGALRNGAAPTPERARAYLGRARAREQLQRLTDALADLDEAAAIPGDASLELDILLERATALDLTQDYDGAAKITAIAAATLAAATELPRRDRRALAARLVLAEGRADYRAGRLAEAVAKLRDAVATARAEGLETVETVAELLLGPALVDLGSLGEAEAVFDKTIARSSASGDRFHLGAAYANRSGLWYARGELERTALDLRVVIQIAREQGHAHLERAATYNLAEDQLARGKLDDALQLARRSFALQHAHGEWSTHLDRMLLARIHGARGDLAELREVVVTLAAEAQTDDERVTLAVLRAAADGDGAVWDAALSALPALPLPLRLELGYVAARFDRLSSVQRAELHALARTDCNWEGRAPEFLCVSP